MLTDISDIHSVSPHVGAANGGTLLTIKGRGFGNDPSLVAVDIDGTPCIVVSVTTDTVTCRTTMPPADSKAVVNMTSAGSVVNMTLPGVEDGYRFMGRRGWTMCIVSISYSILGGRGVTLQRYLNIWGADLTYLYSATKFPDSPDSYSVYPSFQSKSTTR